MSRQRRSLLALAAMVPWVHAGRSLAASRYDFRAILGQDVQRYAQALQALRDRFGQIPADENPRRLQRLPRPTAYLALGADALSSALETPLDAPVVALFASRQTYERAVAASPAAPPSTAIYAEPSPEHQMRLIAALYKRTIVVGVFVSPETAYLEPLLREAAAAQRLPLEVVRLGPNAGLTRSLNLLESATVLLIHPDSNLYTQASLRELLESSYRRRLPVIGFSSALVSAGTLASAYSGIDDTLTQLDGLLDQIASRRLPPPRYPAYWRVAVNDSVARSLDVVVGDAVRSLGDRP